VSRGSFLLHGQTGKGTRNFDSNKYAVLDNILHAKLNGGHCGWWPAKHREKLESYLHPFVSDTDIKLATLLRELIKTNRQIRATLSAIRWEALHGEKNRSIGLGNSSNTRCNQDELWFAGHSI
jgi:hypothetical protein